MTQLLPKALPFLALVLISLSTHAAVVQGSSSVPECTKHEIENLMQDSSVRACAAEFNDLLPPTGCKDLTDESCYCSSPDFMIGLLGCSFQKQPDMQVDLIRCGKWFSCPKLGAELNKTHVELTPESKALLERGAANPGVSVHASPPAVVALTLAILSVMWCWM